MQNHSSSLPTSETIGPRPRDVFARTTCSCALCCAGCRTKPGALIPGDLERIAQHQGVAVTPEWLLQHFSASEGARVYKEGLGTTNIPSVVPDQKPNGHCVFLSETGQCSIHPVAPFGCSHMDHHMDQAEGSARARHMVMDQMYDHATQGSYSQACQFLADNYKLAEPSLKRQQAYSDEVRRIEQHGKEGVEAEASST